MTSPLAQCSTFLENTSLELFKLFDTLKFTFCALLSVSKLPEKLSVPMYHAVGTECREHLTPSKLTLTLIVNAFLCQVSSITDNYLKFPHPRSPTVSLHCVLIASWNRSDRK